MPILSRLSSIYFLSCVHFFCSISSFSFFFPGPLLKLCVRIMLPTCCFIYTCKIKSGLDAEPVPDPNGLKVVVTKAGKNGEQVHYFACCLCSNSHAFSSSYRSIYWRLKRLSCIFHEVVTYTTPFRSYQITPPSCFIFILHTLPNLSPVTCCVSRPTGA